MTVYLVGAGPGDPDLLTRRAVSLLALADVVVHDRLVSPAILTLVPERTELIDVGKDSAGGPDGSVRQATINQLLVDHGRSGRTVVRLKGGDPFVFGRGGEEVEALTEAGIPWEVIPGVSSAFAVPATAGIPVTQRGVASAVTVVTGRVGDPSAPGGVDWDALVKVNGTIVILMGMSTRAEIADALQRGGKPGETPIAVIERGTTPQQRTVRTTLAQLAQVDLGSPSIIVVGPVAALGAAGSPAAGPLSGKWVVVTRSGARAQGVSELVRQAGGRVIELPLTTQIGPADDGKALRAAAAAIEQYEWLVVTSVNAVERFVGELRDARTLARTKVAAVGPATADALRLGGIEPDLVPAEHWAQGLIEAFPDAAAGSGPVLFPCADQAPSTIPDGLAEKGWRVDRVEAYRTVALTKVEPGTLELVAAADAVFFTAASSLRAFLALRGPDGSALPMPPAVVCIGPTTAQSALDEGIPNVVTASGASDQGMVDALIDHWASGSGHAS
jgi:uroporphyrinogen III methyltransferase / synthase